MSITEPVITGTGSGAFLGTYATPAELNTAHPTATLGNEAFVLSTETYWRWDGTAWSDTAIRRGITASNPTMMTHAMFDANGNLVNSSVFESATLLESRKAGKFPSGGAIEVGVTDINSDGAPSGGGSGITFKNLADNTTSRLIHVPYGSSGSSLPYFDELGEEQTIPSLSDTSDVRSAEFNFVNPLSGVVTEYTVHRETGTPTLTNCNFTIWLGGYNNGVPLYDYKETTGGTGFTLEAGFNVVTPPTGIGFPANMNPNAPSGEQVRLYAHVTDNDGNLIELSGQVVTFPVAPDPRAEQVWIPYLERKVQFSTIQEIVPRDDSATDTNHTWSASKIIAEMSAGGRWRGSHSTANTYQAGDVVTHLFAGVERLYMAATAQAPNSGTPTSGSAIGAWRAIDDVTGKGAWVDGHYKFGDIVSHNSDYWMANTTIALGQPAPSSTNTAWVQINGGGSGGGTSPTVQYLRQASITLPNDTSDNTYLSVETTGTNVVTVTMPDATATNVGARITVINRRPAKANEVSIAFASGDSVPDLFGDTLDLQIGESVTLIVNDNNVWSVASNGQVQLVPSFPSNPNNDDNTFMFSVNGDTPASWTRDRNTSINLNRTSGSIQSYEIANPSTSGITVNDGEGYVYRNIGSVNWNVFPFAGGNTTVIDGVTITSGSPFVLQPNRSLALVYDTSSSRWEGQEYSFLVPVGSVGAGGATGQSETSSVNSGITGTNLDVLASNGIGSTANHGDIVRLIGQDGSQEFVESNLANMPSGVHIGETLDGGNGFVRKFGIVSSVPVFDSSGNQITTTLPNGTLIYLKSESGQNNMVTNDSESGVHPLWGQIVGSRSIEGGGSEHDYFFDIDQFNVNVIAGQVQNLSVTVGNFNNRLVNLERPIVRPSTANDTYNITGTNIQHNTIYSIGGTDVNLKTVNIGDTSGWNLSSGESTVFWIDNTHSTSWLKIVSNVADGNFYGMSTNTFYIKPKEIREIRILNEGSTRRTEVAGRVSYKFEAEKGLLGGGAWTVNSGIISDIVAPVTGNGDRLGFNTDGDIEGLSLSMDWLFTGTAASDFASLQALTPSANLLKNGINFHAAYDAQVLNLASASTFYHVETDTQPVANNDYITITGTDLTDVSGTTLSLRGEIVLKQQ